MRLHDSSPIQIRYVAEIRKKKKRYVAEDFRSQGIISCKWYSDALSDSWFWSSDISFL